MPVIQCILRVTFFSLLVLIYGSFASVSASEPNELFGFSDSDPDALFFQEIPSVVTPARMEQRPWHSPSTVTVIPEEKIRKWGARSVADLLRHVGGVNVRQYGMNHLVAPRGGNNDVYIFNLLVLLDGIPVNDPILGEFDLGPDFPVEMIKKVEVVRGPGSSLYGANAYSGVVNLVTRAPDDMSDTKFSGQFGPDGHHKFIFEAGESSIDDGWLLGGRYFDTEGRDRHVVNNNDALHDVDFWGKYTSGKASVFLKSSNGRQGRPLDMNDADEDDSERADSILFNGKFNFFDTPESSLTGRVYANSINGSYPGPPFTGTRVPYDSKRIGASLQMTRELAADQTIVAGMEFADKSGEWLDIGGKRTSHESAFYIQDEIGSLKDWTFTIGGRLDYDSKFGSTASPRFSAIRFLDAKKSIRFSAGRAYRAPTYSEQYIEAYIGQISGIPLQAVGNPDLDPEFVTSYEMGFEHRPSEKLMYSLVLYHNIQSNHIELIPYFDPSLITIIPTNLSSSTAQGVELDLTTQISKKASFNLNYTFQEVYNDETKNSLDYVPKHQGNVNLEYDFSKKMTSAILFHVQSESQGNFSEPVSGFYTIDAKFQFQVTDDMGISLSGYNLLDREYFETELYPMPGRTILTEVSFRF